MPYRHIYQGLWIFLAVSWVVSASGNKPTAFRVNPGWRFAVLGLTVVFIALVFAFPETLRRRVIPFSTVTEWTGIVLCAAGVAFAIWARRTLGRNWSGNPTIKEGHELIESGPYRFVRHPIYTGILAAVVGTLLGGGKVDEVILLIASVAILSFKMSVEESLMMRQFPQAYPEYRKRTKALIPYIL